MCPCSKFIKSLVSHTYEWVLRINEEPHLLYKTAQMSAISVSLLAVVPQQKIK